jgi:hypothetical protein
MNIKEIVDPDKIDRAKARKLLDHMRSKGWASHKDLANYMYLYTGNQQLGVDFFNLETEFVSQDDLQSTGLKGLDIDPFQEDRERVNNILSLNKIPLKIVKMRHNEAFETEYQTIATA